MLKNILQKEQPVITKPDEKILVLKRCTLFESHTWSGLQSEGMDFFQKMVTTEGQFEWRSTMEQDPTYKQVIPYLIFNYQNNFFIMQRRSNATEERLKNKFSLGIGGHVRETDMTGSTIFDWAAREFHEEVSYNGTLDIQPLGILNDDSNSVGQVHIGFVLLCHGASPEISIKSEHKQGILIPFNQLNDFFDQMEPWSQIVFEYLKKQICHVE